MSHPGPCANRPLAKDSELRQATSELETQLRLAATSLSEYKLRAANAETKLGELSNTATKSVSLEKELKDRNQLIAKLRHDGESRPPSADCAPVLALERD